MDKLFTMCAGAACAAILTIGGFLIGKKVAEEAGKTSFQQEETEE